MTKQQELSKALQKEFKRLEPHVGEDVRNEFEVTILLLETGYYNVSDIEKYDLLEAALNDFEQLYNDYCK
jgi:hypothetical protein